MSGTLAAVRSRGLAAAGALALVAAACGGAAPEGRSPRAEPSAGVAALGPGPAAGETLPPFELPDQTGRVWTFESLRGPKGLVLNINRSVVW